MVIFLIIVVEVEVKFGTGSWLVASLSSLRKSVAYIPRPEREDALVLNVLENLRTYGYDKSGRDAIFHSPSAIKACLRSP